MSESIPVGVDWPIRISAALLAVLPLAAWLASHIAAKRCAKRLTFVGSWKSENVMSFESILLVDVGRTDGRGQAEGRLHDLGQRLVRENLEGVLDRGRLAREIKGEAHALILVSGVLLHHLLDILSRRTRLRRAGLSGIAAQQGEIERVREVPVTRVRQLVGKAVGARRALRRRRSYR